MASNTSRFLVAGLAALAVGGAFVGCGGDDTGAPPSNGNAQTYDYVISGITIDDARPMTSEDVTNPATFPRGIAGFDLDGRKTGPMSTSPRDCGQGDYFSSLDPDQNMGNCVEGMGRGGMGCMGGVDNQLPKLATTIRTFMASLDLRASLSNAVMGRTVNILMRVSDVNGTPGPGFNDSSVTVRIYPIGQPMFSTNCQNNDPGRPYAIDARSLTNPSDVNSAVRMFQGSIVNGRLRLNPPTSRNTPNFSFTLPVNDRMVDIDLFAAQLRIDLTANGGTRGNLGGYIRLSDLAIAIARLGIVSEEQVRMFAPLLQSLGLIDVEVPEGGPMGCGESTNDAGIPNTGGIGFGVNLTASRAQIAAMPVTGAQPGMCGSSSTPSDGGAPADASTPRD